MLNVDFGITYRMKAVRIMSFVYCKANFKPLLKNLDMLKLTDIVKHSNFLSTYNTRNKDSPAVFDNYFLFNETSHLHETFNSLISTHSVWISETTNP